MDTKQTKKLTRSSKDRMISGVCGGMAEYFNIDSSLMRIIWVVLALAGGAGILLYLAAILIIPLEGEKETKSSSRPDAKAVWGIILIILGIIFLLSSLNWHCFDWFRFNFWGFFWPLIIVIIGVALIINSTKKRVPSSETPEYRRCYRLREDRMFLGVAGGTGKYFNFDFNLARLLWVFFIILSGGVGLIIYLIMYFILPEEPFVEEISDSRTEKKPDK